jgi:hypothetical protein
VHRPRERVVCARRAGPLHWLLVVVAGVGYSSTTRPHCYTSTPPPSLFLPPPPHYTLLTSTSLHIHRNYSRGVNHNKRNPDFCHFKFLPPPIQYEWSRVIAILQLFFHANWQGCLSAIILHHNNCETLRYHLVYTLDDCQQPLEIVVLHTVFVYINNIKQRKKVIKAILQLTLLSSIFFYNTLNYPTLYQLSQYYNRI